MVELRSPGDGVSLTTVKGKGTPDRAKDLRASNYSVPIAGDIQVYMVYDSGSFARGVQGG